MVGFSYTIEFCGWCLHFLLRLFWLVRDRVLSSSVCCVEATILWAVTLGWVAMVEEDRLSSMDMFDRADRRMSSSMRGVGERLRSVGAGFFTADLHTCFSFVLLPR